MPYDKYGRWVKVPVAQNPPIGETAQGPPTAYNYSNVGGPGIATAAQPITARQYASNAPGVPAYVAQQAGMVNGINQNPYLIQQRLMEQLRMAALQAALQGQAVRTPTSGQARPTPRPPITGRL